jgi:hypothetical protein
VSGSVKLSPDSAQEYVRTRFAGSWDTCEAHESDTPTRAREAARGERGQTVPRTVSPYAAGLIIRGLTAIVSTYVSTSLAKDTASREE